LRELSSGARDTALMERGGTLVREKMNLPLKKGGLFEAYQGEKESLKAVEKKKKSQSSSFGTERRAKYMERRKMSSLHRLATQS